MVQNGKKICPFCFMSQEPYIIWFSFVVHKYKIMISPGVFFHFFKIFQILVKNYKKLCALCLISQESCIIYDCHLEYTRVKWLFLKWKFWFFQLLEGAKGKRWSKMTKSSVRCAFFIRSNIILPALSSNFRKFFHFFKILFFVVFFSE